MNAILRWSFATLAIAGLMAASPAMASKIATTSAQLIVEDNGDMFSRDAIQKAKSTIAGSMGEGNRQMHIETYKGLTDSQKKEFDAAGKDKSSFWKSWAKDKAMGDRGIIVLINRSPGHVHVLADKQMRDKGFSPEKEQKLQQLFTNKLKEAAEAKTQNKPDSELLALRDAALLSAADYVRAEMPSSTQTTKAEQSSSGNKKDSSNVGSYICLGICILLGVWLVIGIIRALTGSGGGGGGYGGGGGGGGGFFSGLMGGLFGAMAGMWLYNNMFGGGGSSAWGGDNGGGDTGGGEAGGAGDFSGDNGSGGDFDGGSGGDFGGGSGGGGDDWGGGGGGDWGGGGGGGDFGGGGGDF